MSEIDEIMCALRRLSLAEMQQIQGWLDERIEDQLEVSDEFKGKIQRAETEIADGVYSRTRRPYRP